MTGPTAELSIDTAPKKPNARKAVIGSMVGNILEWYDYFVYGTLAGLVIPHLFFPETDTFVGMIAGFSTFFVGFLARPLGGIIFGHIGDSRGRKSSLILSLLVMAGASLLIGFLPTYEQVGWWAPALLVLLRFVQGIGVGGEWGGAVILSAESSPKKRRGFVTALVETAAPVATLLAVFSVSVSSNLSGANFNGSDLTAGWRWPFYASVLIALVAFYLRRKVDESPEFLAALEERKALGTTKNAPKERIPLVRLFKTQGTEVALAALLRAAENSSYYIFTTFAIPLGVLYANLAEQTLYDTITIASALCIPFLVFSGWLSDKIGRTRVYVGSAVLMIVLTVAFFLTLQSGVTTLIIVGFAMSLIPWALHYGAQPALILESFKTDQRYSGASLGYQIGSPVWGGLSPLIATLLAAINVWLVAVYLVVLCLITIGATLYLRATVKRKGVLG
jgi:MFS transporter, MHS family, shikimate and dehydroshikimate transport protein